MVRLLLAASTLAAVFLAVSLATPADASLGRQGDADCDAQVDQRDALAVLLDDTPCGDLADTDCDGDATALDAVRILRFRAGLQVGGRPDCTKVGDDIPDRTATPTTTPTETDDGPEPSDEPTDGPPTAPTVTPTLTPTPTVTPTDGPSHTPTPTPTPQAPTPGPTATPPPVVTGVEPSCQVFPADNWWNTDISAFPVHANSQNYINSIGPNQDLHPDFGTVWDGKPIGIPYVVVGGSQPKVPVSFYYPTESDPGPYPIPPNVPVEGQPVGQPNTASFGGDRHTIVIDDENCILYETYDSWPVNGGASWDTGSGAIFDLSSNALRADTWTSADAAGLPIFPGLVRYSEVVEEGVIDHALRFTVAETQTAFIHPATHYASDNPDPNVPPMGLRLRMKASYDCTWATSEVQVICAAMKKYGMFVADNGADWYVSGAPDPRWDDDRIGDLKSVPGSAFEVVDTGEDIITAN